MCGRYFVDDEMWREIKKICKQIDDSKLKVTRGDVCPTDMAVVLMGMKEVRTGNAVLIINFHNIFNLF